MTIVKNEESCQKRVVHGPDTHPEEWDGVTYMGGDGYTMHLDAGGFFEAFFELINESKKAAEARKQELKTYLDTHRESASKHFGRTLDETTDELVVAYVDMAGDGADSMPDCVFEVFKLSGYHRTLPNESEITIKEDELPEVDAALPASHEAHLAEFHADRAAGYTGSIYEWHKSKFGTFW
jgi:hypothetical protein